VVRGAGPEGERSARRARWALALLFVGLLAAFAIGLWGTLLRPPAYEVRGVFVSRPSSDLILVRHEAIEPLGMPSMELMGIAVEGDQLAGLRLTPGDRVRLAVRAQGDRLVLLRIERLH
jgi:hypothetical protein